MRALLPKSAFPYSDMAGYNYFLEPALVDPANDAEEAILASVAPQEFLARQKPVLFSLP